MPPAEMATVPLTSSRTPSTGWPVRCCHTVAPFVRRTARADRRPGASMARYTRPPRPTDISRARSLVAVRHTVAPVESDRARTTGTPSSARPT